MISTPSQTQDSPVTASVNMPNTSDTNTAYVNLSAQAPDIENVPAYDYGFREPLLSNNTWFTPEQAAWKFNVPFLGRLRLVKDPLGIAAMTCIVSYWFCNAIIHAFHLLLPAYIHGFCPLGLVVAYFFVGFSALAAAFLTTTKNPGALDTFSSPDASWTVCQKCNQSRPPEAHHCRRCGQCVRKMDHHCPWLNNCVGEDNRYTFMLLLVYVTALAVMTGTFDFLLLYQHMPCIDCHQRTYLLVLGMDGFLKFSFLSSILLSMGGSGLLVAQHLSIAFQIPTMEMNRLQMDLILHKKFPAKIPEVTEDLWGAYRQVCGQGAWCLWPIPCRKRRTKIMRTDAFHV